MANHPLIFLALLGWATGRASGAVAGEVERGTLDLTLSRPVRRSTYLAAQVLATMLAFALLIGSTIAGHLVAPFVFRIHAPPAPGRVSAGRGDDPRLLPGRLRVQPAVLEPRPLAGPRRPARARG